MEDQERKDESRRIFSISNEFSDVNDILNSIPKSARSRYICEAIREKYERESNPHSIENQVRAMLTHIVHAEQYASQIQQSLANKGIHPSNLNQGKPVSFLYQMLSGIPLFGTAQISMNHPMPQTTQETTAQEEKTLAPEIISKTESLNEALTEQQVSATAEAEKEEIDETTGIDENHSENHLSNQADSLPQQQNSENQNRGSRKIKRKLIETSLGT